MELWREIVVQVVVVAEAKGEMVKFISLTRGWEGNASSSVCLEALGNSRTRIITASTYGVLGLLKNVRHLSIMSNSSKLIFFNSCTREQMRIT